MIDLSQLREHIIRPTLHHLGLYSVEAEELVFLTGLHESRYKYIKQIRGPALGFWQMEPVTHDDIWKRYLLYKSHLRERLMLLVSRRNHLEVAPQEMIGNIAYGCAMCRIHYLRVPKPLPNTLKGMADYWKTYYNTVHGKGTVEQFIHLAEKYP